MSVIVDTAIWSLALRRNRPERDQAIVGHLQTLILDNQALMLGPVRQEVLSGIRTPEQFERLQAALRAFPDLPLAREDYELAAEFYNTCRHNGIQGSNADFLICAAADRRSHSIFTTDRDFKHFQACIPVNLLPLEA